MTITEAAPQAERPIAYDVSNRITGETRRFKTSNAAIKHMDQADNAYGACITTRRAIWS